MALVVDDAPSMRSVVGATLRQEGYDVTEAGNGQEALIRAAGLPRLDVVICDLNMPIMNGLAFIQKLRAQPARRFTPILLLTTEQRPEEKEKAKQAGATGWLTKPFDPKALAGVLARVIK
jgi:two-component system chemotaxis response regulator CheY